MIYEIRDNIEKIIIGKQEVVDFLLAALLAKGHVLIEDVPGVGKTTLAKALAKTLDVKFSRIQFTPDLLPTDVVGVSVYNQKTREFEFMHGPIKANVILADEINRASPKTQSSLLEAMAERQYTVDGNTYKLEDPFIVIATQNPVEFEGTFPLPEAQLDRFMMKLSMGYPSFDNEISILDRDNSMISIDSIATKEIINNLSKEVSEVEVTMNIKKFIVEIIHKTRKSKDVILPASPRASQDLYQASKALAFIKGRNFVVPDDVIELAPYIISHRIIINPETKFRGLNEFKIVYDLVRTIKVDIDEKIQEK
ncbi:MAG: MoxR family ATPase [Bacillota bacterium]|nr:MoxR family ATPase [Bacillota bacterium]